MGGGGAPADGYLGKGGGELGQLGRTERGEDAGIIHAHSLDSSAVCVGLCFHFFYFLVWGV